MIEDKGGKERNKRELEKRHYDEKMEKTEKNVAEGTRKGGESKEFKREDGKHGAKG
jgi:hypothetical protein